ncbi:ABC transporter substrate-binding protein [Nocardioides sp. HM23]|uniref:ABC transporter substrate-binding protein n=1 Tax=Nocardioides bizhenqiangii TaxID=3095076 RepID=UPI002ACAB4DF|nr:ABC transporter substrate-binding protein [Nocardioides sp. HM23]MDZ5623287.1 ABC transporter substrate-binding protein [Nocardioides sp. HM23]
MSGRGVVPESLGLEVSEQDGGVRPTHPVVGIGAHHSVLGVLVRFARRLGRAERDGHTRHRRPVRGFVAAAGTLVVGLLLATVGASPVQPAGAAADDEPVTFTVAFLDEVDSFNPFNGFQATSYEMWALMYDYMVGYSMEDISPAPALATSWETSDDGLTWTFDIREGVDWSDGEPLTAGDIAYTYNRIIDGGPESGNWGTYLTSVETVSAPDDTTVVLELSKPNAVLPLLPIPILPEHIWSDVAEDDVKSYRNEPSDGEPVVGSGAFRLVEGTAGGSTYLFEANPDYYGGTPHVDRVAFRVYKSEDPAVQAIIKGEVDFVDDISPIQVEALQGRDGIHAQNGVSPYFEEIAFNVGAVDPETGEPLGDGNPALEDPAFRYALGFALDNERLVEAAYQGAAVPGDTFIPTAYESWRWEPPEDVAFTFDLDRAGELLDEAGYEVGSDGLRTMPDGSEIGTIRLFARTEEPRSQTIMEFFQEWLAEIGIESEVSVMESNQLTDVILDGNFDAFHWGWFVEPDPDSILSVFLCDARGGSSDSWYCNPEFDELYASQNAELDDEKRIETVQRMQEIIYRDAPYLVTAYTTYGQAVRTDRFACFQPQPDPDGVLLVQYGAFNYTLLRPADEAGDCDGIESAVGASSSSGDDDDGTSNGVLIAGGVLLALLLVGGVVFALRRRSSADARE